MTNLKQLPIEQRRLLAEEAKQRRLSGETPNEICAALGLSATTYRRWAQLLGFRKCDLDSGVAQDD